MKSEDIFSTGDDCHSGGEERGDSKKKSERLKRKKLSSGGSSDVAGTNELREEVKGIKVFLSKIDLKLECLTELKEEISGIAKSVEKMWQKVEDMERKYEKLTNKSEKTVEQVKKVDESVKQQQIDLGKTKTIVNENCDRIRLLEERSIDQEARSRRNNVMVFGVAEKENEDCGSLFRKEVLERCGITSGVVIERVHRFGKPIQGKSRPIIARFLDFNTKQRVMRSKKGLPDNVRVTDDLPLSIREARKKLLPALKDARDKGKDAYIAYPARLIVDGDLAGMERPCLDGDAVQGNRKSREHHSYPGRGQAWGNRGGQNSGRGSRGGHTGGK